MISGIRHHHHHGQRCWAQSKRFQSCVIHLSRNMTSEISSRGVLVNTISPGGILTDIFTKLLGWTGSRQIGPFVSYRIYSPPYRHRTRWIPAVQQAMWISAPDEPTDRTH